MFFFRRIRFSRGIKPTKTARWSYDLHQKQALIEVLLAYDNVQVYDFQARADWICDLDQLH